MPFAPNLFKGRIFASKPKHGDIVITKSFHDLSTTFIKRVVGLPGEKLEIINDQIYINDQPIKRIELGSVKDEKNQIYIKFKEIFPNGASNYSYKLKINPYFNDENFSNFGPYFIPENHYFLLGDNRDQSGDSRFQFGFVHFDNLIAKAQFIIFSTKDFLFDSKYTIIRQIKQVSNWLYGIRFNRIFNNLYNVQTNE